MDLPLDCYEWNGESYKPLFYSHDWMTALMNWDPIWALEKAHDIERHKLTDEVFVLLLGKAAFYLATEAGLDVVEIKPHVIYNVRKGAWHNLLATRDAKFLIVENRDTDLKDTDIRPLTPEEGKALEAKAPAWAR